MFIDKNPKHWKLFFYYNPDESSLFVAKRSRLGLTLNFAKPMAWTIVALPLAIAIIGLVIDKFHLVR
jgi:uncharacterized membrane protein